MTTGSQVGAAVEEVVARLDDADRLITAQAGGIEALEAEVEVLRTKIGEGERSGRVSGRSSRLSAGPVSR